MVWQEVQMLIALVIKIPVVTKWLYAVCAPPRSALHIKTPAPFIFLSLWLLSILILLFYSLRGKEQGFSCLERCLLFIQLFMFVAPLSERRRAGFSGLMRRADTEPPFVSAGEKRQEAQ